MLMPTTTAPQSATPTPAYPKTTYHRATVGGVGVFYRAAGNPQNPAIVLLHGFPSSSHMFRELIPALAGDYYVIAPDYPGFGASDAPAPTEFAYTFDHLADVVESLLEQIGVRRFALYLHDYGGPVGFRLATRHPERITALILQNANAYLEGLNLPAFAALPPFWAGRTAATEAPVRAWLTPETTQFQYFQGAHDPAAISPDGWRHDQAGLDRAGNDLVQLALLHDYQHNPPLYPVWQAYFRRHQPPALITWGRHDPFFTEAGARAFPTDLPQAELHLLETGHFALEEAGPVIAAWIREFLPRAAGVRTTSPTASNP